jgi:hypothetical protein
MSNLSESKMPGRPRKNGKPQNEDIPPRQKAFIQEYLKDSNGTRAAKAVGYSEKTAGKIAYKILQNGKVKAELSRRQAKILEVTGITAKFVLQDLKDIVEEVSTERSSGYYQVRLRALELLGKHLGLWDQGNGDTAHRRVSELTDKELVALGMELAKNKTDKQPAVPGGITTIPATIEDAPCDAGH